jgi:hypothetical protein
MPGRQHDGTTLAAKAWYAHFLLPRPTFGPAERELLGAALAQAGWTADTAGESALSQRWRRSPEIGLVAHTLGWFPLLLTAGPIGRPRRPHRAAIAALDEAVRRTGGRVMSDRDLADYLPQARERWQLGLAERRRIDQAARALDSRQCPRCGVWADPLATHCPGCEHRFTPADDAARDGSARRAKETIRTAEVRLAELGRGVLLDRISTPDQVAADG